MLDRQRSGIIGLEFLRGITITAAFGSTMCCYVWLIFALTKLASAYILALTSSRYVGFGFYAFYTSPISALSSTEKVIVPNSWFSSSVDRFSESSLLVSILPSGLIGEMFRFILNYLLVKCYDSRSLMSRWLRLSLRTLSIEILRLYLLELSC